MYSPATHGTSDVGDVEIIANGDDLHLFHLTLPSHDVVQHAVSRDGLSWTALPPAIWTGAPGDVDDDQIWTLSVTRRDDGIFVMVYTALSRAEAGMIQRTAVATSPDLLAWIKTGNEAVAEADPRWYEASLEAAASVSWRDPKPVRVGERWYATVCARVPDGPIMQRGAVGLMVSDDLETWDVRPPLFAPHRFWDLECPQVFTVAGTWYLTAGIMEDGTQRYWLADRFDGPYVVPPDGGILAPRGHYAGRVARWRGDLLFACWHRPLTHLAPVRTDWVTPVNPAGKFIPAPLVVRQRPDRSLMLTSFAGWDGYRTAEPAALRSTAHTALQHVAVSDSAWTLAPPPGTSDRLLSNSSFGDVLVEGTLRLDAAAGGLLFRIDDEVGEGYHVELRPGSRQVVLRRWLLTRDPYSGKPWFNYTDYQRAELDAPFPARRDVPFRLILSGPYIEVSLDGRVVIATLSGQRLQGTFGVWVDSGRATLGSLTMSPLRAIMHR